MILDRPTMKSASQNECPNCGAGSIVTGRILGRADLGLGFVFRPQDLKLFSVTGRSDVPMPSKVRCCLNCGFLWTSVDCRKLQKVIGLLGNTNLKHKLESIPSKLSSIAKKLV